MPGIGGPRDALARVIVDRPGGRRCVHRPSARIPQSTVVSGDDHSIQYDRTGTVHVCAIWAQREDQGPRGGIDDNRGAVVLEVEGIAMLIGSEDGTVHQDTAVNEIEAPATCALKHSCDLRTGR